VPIVLKSGSLKLLEPSGPLQAFNGIALPFTVVHEDDTFLCSYRKQFIWKRECFLPDYRASHPRRKISCLSVSLVHTATCFYQTNMGWTEHCCCLDSYLTFHFTQQERADVYFPQVHLYVHTARKFFLLILHTSLLYHIFPAFPLLSAVAKTRESLVIFINPPVRHGIVPQRIQVFPSLNKMGGAVATDSQKATASHNKHKKP
jgi:hypothetical protein